MGFFITLQTNASLIPKYQKLFENYPPRSIKITLYGSNNETYKKVCQIDNGFTKVHQSIQLLKKMNIPIQLVSTITKQNLDDIKKMAFYAYINQLPWTSTGGIKNSFRNGSCTTCYNATCFFHAIYIESASFAFFSIAYVF